MSAIHASDCKFCGLNNIGYGVRGDGAIFLYCEECEAQGPTGTDYENARALWNGSDTEEETGHGDDA